MQAAPAISRPPSPGRTLQIAAWVLALTAVAEIAAGGFALSKRQHAGAPLSIQVPPPGLMPETAGKFTPVDPFASAANATPAPRQAASPVAIAGTPSRNALTASNDSSLPKPTPVEERQVVTPESRVDSLVAQARALRERGDMSTAINRLKVALALSPKNALLFAELAATYEKMGLDDKALEQWRQIYDMGESAGIYYQAADAKLKAAQLAQAQSTVQTQSSPAGKPGDNVVESGGFQPGSSLALVNLSTVEKPETSEGLKRFTLKIPVKRRPDAKINVSDVIIQVFFYDQLANDIVRTDANVSSHWSTLPADWQQEDIEILEVDYTQSKPDPGQVDEDRHYFGYVVCVYYKKELQDMAADPQSLLKKFPPPLTLPEKGDSAP